MRKILAFFIPVFLVLLIIGILLIGRDGCGKAEPYTIGEIDPYAEEIVRAEVYPSDVEKEVEPFHANIEFDIPDGVSNIGVVGITITYISDEPIDPEITWLVGEAPRFPRKTKECIQKFPWRRYPCLN